METLPDSLLFTTMPREVRTSEARSRYSQLRILLKIFSETPRSFNTFKSELDSLTRRLGRLTSGLPLISEELNSKNRNRPLQIRLRDHN